MNLSGSELARRRAAIATCLGLFTGSKVLPSPTAADCEAFWREVRALPRRQQQTVALFYLRKGTVRDVGETLHLPESDLHCAR